MSPSTLPPPPPLGELVDLGIRGNPRVHWLREPGDAVGGFGDFPESNDSWGIRELGELGIRGNPRIHGPSGSGDSGTELGHLGPVPESPSPLDQWIRGLRY